MKKFIKQIMLTRKLHYLTRIYEVTPSELENPIEAQNFELEVQGNIKDCLTKLRMLENGNK